MRYINEKTFADGGHALRSVHAKTHGILQGYLEVDTDLPDDLAQGLFAKPGRYPVVMRFSTLPGDVLDDSVSTPRGLAIKVIGVEGERLEGSEGDVTQDFVLINGTAFGAPNPKKFLSVMRLLARTTDKAQRFKKILSAVMRQVQKAIVVATGHPNTTVATLGGQPETHILGETFYSQAPYVLVISSRKFRSAAQISRIEGSRASVTQRQRRFQMDSEKRSWSFSGNMAVYGSSSAVSAPTLNICRSRTLRSFGRRRSVLISGSLALRSSHNWRGARPDHQQLTMVCCSLPGTDLLHTVPSAESCAFERQSMKRRRNSGPKETAG